MFLFDKIDNTKNICNLPLRSAVEILIKDNTPIKFASIIMEGIYICERIHV